MAKYSVSYVYELVDKYSRTADRISKSTHGMTKAKRKATVTIEKFKRGLKAQASEMMKSKLAIAGLAVAFGMFARSVFTNVLTFEKSMNRVSAVTMASKKELKSMRGLAKELGSTTAFTASQSADALVFLSQAGLDVKQSMDALPATLQLAAAGNIDLASAADIATNVMSMMGMEVSELSRVNDVLAKSQSIANTDILQLSEAMRPVGATAKNLGLDIEELSTMLGIMANSGEKGSIAGTLLRNMMTNMAAPSKAQLKTYKKLGISIRDYTDEMGRIKNMKGFIGALEDINTKGKLSVDNLQTLFGDRGFRAAQLLIGAGGDAMSDFEKKLRSAGGTAKEMADRQMAGLVGVTKELASAWEGFKLAIGGDDTLLGGAARGVVKLTTGLVKAITPSGEFSRSLGNMIRTVGLALEPLAKFFAAIFKMSALEGIASVFKVINFSLKTLTSGLITVIRLFETLGMVIGMALGGGDMSQIGNMIKGAISSAGTELNDIWGFDNPAAQGEAARKGADGKSGEVLVSSKDGTPFETSGGVTAGLGSTVAATGM